MHGLKVYPGKGKFFGMSRKCYGILKIYNEFIKYKIM